MGYSIRPSISGSVLTYACVNLGVRIGQRTLWPSLWPVLLIDSDLDNDADQERYRLRDDTLTPGFARFHPAA